MVRRTDVVWGALGAFDTALVWIARLCFCRLAAGCCAAPAAEARYAELPDRPVRESWVTSVSLLESLVPGTFDPLWSAGWLGWLGQEARRHDTVHGRLTLGRRDRVLQLFQCGERFSHPVRWQDKEL